MPYYRIQILKSHLQLISLWIGGRKISAPQSFVQFFSCATLCNQCLRILILIKHYPHFYTNGMRCDCTCNHSNLKVKSHEYKNCLSKSRMFLEEIYMQ